MVGAQGTEVGAFTVAHLPGLTCPLWLGEVTSQEQDQPVVSRIPLSQKSDTKPVVNAGARSEHRGGSDHCSTPPPLATEEVLPEEVLLHEALLQEQSKPVVKPSTPPSQNSHLNSGGNARGSSELGGESDRCSTPPMADIPCGYGKVSLQGQARPGAVSRMRSSQRNDTNSGGDVGGNSGHQSGGDLYSTPTWADASRC